MDVKVKYERAIWFKEKGWKRYDRNSRVEEGSHRVIVVSPSGVTEGLCDFADGRWQLNDIHNEGVAFYVPLVWLDFQQGRNKSLVQRFRDLLFRKKSRG